MDFKIKIEMIIYYFKIVQKHNYYDGNESVIESVVDNALYYDPKTNGDSQNAINQFQNSLANATYRERKRR